MRERCSEGRSEEEGRIEEEGRSEEEDGKSGKRTEGGRKRTYPLNSSRIRLCQIHMHNLRTEEIIFSLSLPRSSGTKEVIECLWVLIDELSELGVGSSDLLHQRLDQCWVLLNHLNISFDDRRGKRSLPV